MRLKYMIHRSKVPFAIQKRNFCRIIEFLQKHDHPDIVFIDKGLRFGLEKGSLEIDFDFGYRNMRYRDFSRYDHVFAQSAFAIFNTGLNPGDIVFPSKSDMLRINTAQTKVRVYDNTSAFCNGMRAIYDELLEYEKSSEVSSLKDFVSKEFAGKASSRLGSVRDIHVKKDGHFVESNIFFKPSEFKQPSALLKSGEDRLEIPHLQKYLEQRYDGVNMEVKQMIENVGDRLSMFAIAIDKPYADVELTDEIRFSETLEPCLPTYSDMNVAYFQSLLLGYILSGKFEQLCTKQME